MSLIARRILGSLLIILVIIVSLLGAKKESAAVKPSPAAKPETIFRYANDLAVKEGKLPEQIEVGGRLVQLERRGRYSVLCLSDGCALLRDYNKRFLVVVGPKAKKKVWEQRK